MIRRILLAWQRWGFRRSYPMGVYVSDVVQIDCGKFQFKIVNLKNGEILPVTYRAVPKALTRRDDFIESFQDAGLSVFQGEWSKTC